MSSNVKGLPDPFLMEDGSRVSTKEQWEQQRIYLKNMLETELYGTMPPAPKHVSGTVEEVTALYDGTATKQRVRLHCDEVDFVCEIVLPTSRQGRLPVIIWNQAADVQPAPNEKDVLDAGYVIATYNREQLAVDGAEAMRGILGKAYPEYGWGAIAMWAWGTWRIVDYLASTNYADMSKIAVTGHSRGGKTALCAAIYDDRIAACIANGSGCAGAGSFRYMGGRMGEGHGICETLGSMCDAFPYWWSDNISKWGSRTVHHTRLDPNPAAGTPGMFAVMDMNVNSKLSNEEDMPFDCHFIRACIAPRPLLSIDGMADTWSNPFGVHITWRASDEVYEFLDAIGQNCMVMRDGGHQFGKIDWGYLLNFCNAKFFGAEIDPYIQSRVPVNTTNPLLARVAAMAWQNERLHFDWKMPCD